MLRDPEQLMDLRKPELKLSCPEAEGEDGLELSLGLSLGGSYSKSLRRSYWEIGSSKANDVGSRPPLMNGLCSGGTPQWRRELHALRRQEARRKRQTAAAAINGRVRSARTCSLDEKTLLEAKEVQSQCRAKDREGRERDPTPAEWRRSSCKTPENVHSSNPNVTTTSLGPAVPLECTAYQNVQYVPTTNGFGFPYMMPCWAPAVSPSGNGTGCMEVNIFQPVACRGFPLFPVPAASSNGSGWKMPGGEVVDTKPARSSSTGSSPSSISDNQSGSPHGSCNSNDCRSNPNQTLDKIPRRQSSSEIINPQVHSSCSTSCNEMPSSSHVIKEDAEKPVLSSTQASLGSNLMGTASPVSRNLERATSVNKPISKGAEESQDEPSLPQMPCVYTTGNGPNGKTITGFLYRYGKSEVSIACVCHGISFSPAEFVKHAGGTNVSNPLRQIIVVP